VEKIWGYGVFDLCDSDEDNYAVGAPWQNYRRKNRENRDQMNVEQQASRIRRKNQELEIEYERPKLKRRPKARRSIIW